MANVPLHVPLEVKKAYFAKVKSANYAESMRLEGYKVDSPADNSGQSRNKPDKASVLAKYKSVA